MTPHPVERLRAAADLIERTGAPYADLPRAYWYTGQPWIALLSPDTAPALAAWLREEADKAVAVLEMRLGYVPTTKAALIFADQILRDEP